MTFCACDNNKGAEKSKDGLLTWYFGGKNGLTQVDPTELSYQYDGNDIYVNYDYSDSEVQIYAFSNDVVADDQKIALTSEYNPDIGFVEHNGYYFKGYSF